MQSIKELIDARKLTFEQQKAILDAAEGGELSAEAEGQYETLEAEFQRLDKEIGKRNEQARKANLLREREEAIAAQPIELQTARLAPGALPATAELDGTGPRGTKEYRKTFDRYLRGDRLAFERLANKVSDNPSGGYLVAPEQMVNDFLKNVDDAVVIRSLARGFRVTSAKTLGVRCRTAKASTFAYSGEVTVSTADSALKFGKRVLTPHHMTGEIDVTRDLVNSSDMSVEEIVRSELARDSGEVEEQAYMTGNGADRPLGMFTASSDGISTSRDVQTGSTTNFTADGLVDALYALKPQYQARARWLFHRSALKLIRKLKDGEGQYLWQPGLQAGQPDVILGKPVVQSEFAPSTFTTGQYVGMVADFSFYWYADALDLEIQVCFELAARSNQIVYIGRRKHDGMPVLEEAFSRLITN